MTRAPLWKRSLPKRLHEFRSLTRWVASSPCRNETLLATLLRDGLADRSIPPHDDPAVTARLLLCLMRGMRVGRQDRRHAQTGASLKILPFFGHEHF
jgi:hypothetical protein